MTEPTDETLLHGINLEGGRVTLDLQPPEDMIKVLVLSMRGMLGDAENYVEVHLVDHNEPDKRYLCTIQRCEKKTPHQLRQEAEAKATKLEEGIRSELEAFACWLSEFNLINANDTDPKRLIAEYWDLQ